MADTVRVRIYDSRVQAMFLPGGSVWGFTQDITADAANIARARAPKRTGQLAAGIGHSVTPAGRNHCLGTVRSTAPHSLWVIAGVDGFIYPHGRYLWVPRQRGSSARVRRASVRGQRANNFLDRAKREAMLLHGVL